VGSNTLVVQDRIIMKNNVSDATVTLQANNTGIVGTVYGMNLFNTNHSDFTIRSISNVGVVFEEVGVTAQTRIAQGTIISSDSVSTETTKITNTQIILGETSTDTTTLTKNDILLTGSSTIGGNPSIISTTLDKERIEIHNTDGILSQTTTFNQQGVSTSDDLTLDIGNDLILNGNLTETTAGGFTGDYLKITINGIPYKLQLLRQS
jgi:hypothetical protein